MKSNNSLFILILFMFGSLLRAEPLFFDNQYALVESLQQHGFENITVTTRDDSVLMIYYENRMYRNEFFASGIVAALVYDQLQAESVLVLVPCRRAVPICELEIDLLQYKALVNSIAGISHSDMVTVKNVSIPKSTPLARPTLGNVDVTLYPSVSVHLGNYDDRFKMFLAVMPILSAHLWRGATIFAEASIPLYNDVNYYTYKYWDYPQLSRAALNQIVHLPLGLMGNFSFGAFYPNRWGVAGEINRLFLNRRLSVGYNFQYTGSLFYYKKVWNYSELNVTTDKIYAIYFSELLNSQMGLSYNTYLYQDSGLLFEFSRNFKDSSVGFFFGETEYDKFGGMMIRFPFSAKKKAAPKRLRVTLPRYYDYSYRATNAVYRGHVPIQTGVSLNAGTTLTHLYQNLAPNYVKHNTHVYKEAFDYIRTMSERREENDNLFNYLKR